MLEYLARFSSSMTTRERPGQRSAHHQSRQGHARPSAPQQIPEFPAALEEQCHRLAQEVVNIPAAVRDYLSRTEGNPDLTAQLNRLTRELKLRDATIHDLETKLEASKAEIQNLRVKEQTLRDFVLESDPYQAITDGDVVNAFAIVRQLIQRLASSKTLRLEQSPDLKSSGFVVEEDFSTLWQESNRLGRVLILRALLFQKIARQILTQDIFGISGLEENQVKDCDSMSDLSSSLSQFERALIHYNAPDNVVVNWRHSTLKSVEAAGMNKGASGTALAKQLFGCFATFIEEGATEQQRAKLQDGFSELCSQAYALRLLMRKSKENYQCLPIPSGALFEDVEDHADDYGEAHGKAHGRLKVAFTLCDGLVKYRSETEEPLVLEKAHVITTRRQ